MKLKYYLRGLGLGVIFTTVILAISFGIHGKEISDEEIVSRAEKLGMEMKDSDSLFPKDFQESETSEPESEKQDTETSKKNGQKSDSEDSGSNTLDKTDPGTDNKDSEKTGTGADTADSEKTGTGSDQTGSSKTETGADKTGSNKTGTGADKTGSNKTEQGADDSKPNVTLTVKDGDGCRQIAEKLQKLGVIDDTEKFRDYMSKRGLDGMIQSGTFSIPKKATNKEIAKILTAR